MMNYLLSLLIWMPALFSILVLIAGNNRPTLVRTIAFGSAVITFILALSLWYHFDTTTHQMQFVEKYAWVSSYNIYYHLGVDGISMPLILLTALSTLLLISASWGVVNKRVAHYMATFLAMEGIIIGVFASLDSILFYLFWEASLIPMLLVIGIWGGEKRVYASLKFFLYTFLGSVFMLIAVIYMAQKQGSFGILEMYALPLTMVEQSYIFWALFLAFAIKIPVVPFHTWLPTAHVQAPTGGSIILAAIMLKMGGYGFIRFSLPIVPDAAREFAEILLILSLIAVLYIGYIALTQRDMKKLIAYSSVSHMGFVTFGIFAIFAAYAHSDVSALLGLQGAMVQMISHGVVSAAMFLTIGFLYDRTHSRDIGYYGGIAKIMPKFTAFVVFFAMANAGLPITSSFVGEFMIVLSAMSFNIYYAILAALTIIITAGYTLIMVKRVFWGEITNEEVATLPDLSLREFSIFTVIALIILAIGIYPYPLIEVISVSTAHILELALVSKL